MSKYFLFGQKRGKAITLYASALKNLLFFKDVPVCAVQPYPVQPSHLWIYSLILTLMLNCSSFYTLITQTSHATHCHHLRRQDKSSHITALHRGNFTSKWWMNSTKNNTGTNDNTCCAKIIQMFFSWIYFLSLR